MEEVETGRSVAEDTQRDLEREQPEDHLVELPQLLDAGVVGPEVELVGEERHRERNQDPDAGLDDLVDPGPGLVKGGVKPGEQARTPPPGVP